jgi:hypothetical protein
MAAGRIVRLLLLILLATSPAAAERPAGEAVP